MGKLSSAPRSQLVLLAVIIVLIPVFTYRGLKSGLFRQRDNMSVAKQHAAVVRPLLERDPRFVGIRHVGEWTGGMGGLLIAGKVLEEDVDDLKVIIESTSPPVQTSYHLTVLTSEYGLEREKLRAEINRAKAKLPAGGSPGWQLR